METDVGGSEKVISKRYAPPCSMLLDKLGIDASDLRGGRVSVSANALRALISEYAKTMSFDREWYARTNPDVESARLAGDLDSLREHFVTTGYLEGRLPHEPAFDPAWYWHQYTDIANVFPISDRARLRDHFVSKGYFEGRAGTLDTLPDAERWQQLKG